MIWMNEHKRALRVALLILLLVAIAGPWAYDQVNVPAEYPCTDPFVRLEVIFADHHSRVSGSFRLWLGRSPTLSWEWSQGL